MQSSDNPVIRQHPDKQFDLVLLFEILEVAYWQAVSGRNMLLDIVNASEKKALELSMST